MVSHQFSRAASVLSLRPQIVLTLTGTSFFLPSPPSPPTFPPPSKSSSLRPLATFSYVLKSNGSRQEGQKKADRTKTRNLPILRWLFFSRSSNLLRFAQVSNNLFPSLSTPLPQRRLAQPRLRLRHFTSYHHEPTPQAVHVRAQAPSSH